jgi:hypothetical protein
MGAVPVPRRCVKLQKFYIIFRQRIRTIPGGESDAAANCHAVSVMLPVGTEVRRQRCCFIPMKALRGATAEGREGNMTELYGPSDRMTSPRQQGLASREI